jgi:hypothetical protein
LQKIIKNIREHSERINMPINYAIDELLKAMLYQQYLIAELNERLCELENKKFDLLVEFKES